MVIYVRQFAFPADSHGRKKHETEHQAGLELLRTGLMREYGITVSSIAEEISAGVKGKPFLHNYPAIFFNISHGGTMAVCGLDSRPLGVDVEEIRPVKKRVWKRILTEKEKQYLESVDSAVGDREFFRIWTLKESCAKALGLGLAMDFTQIECMLAPQIPIVSWVEGEKLAQMEEVQVRLFTDEGEQEASRWQFYQAVLENRYVVSCCGLTSFAG